MSASDMAALFDKAKELDQLRKEQEEALAEINKIHKKLQTTQDIGEKSGDAILLKLRSLYARAKELSENEVTASTTLIGQLDALPQAGMSAAQRKKIEVSEQKKKRVKSDMDITRVPSATFRNQIDPTSLIGEQVAARVIEDAEKTEWFVVKVMNFDRETKEFEVLDEEPGDDEEPNIWSRTKDWALGIIENLIRGSSFHFLCKSTSYICQTLLLFLREGTFLILLIIPLENTFWLFILELQHYTRQLLFKIPIVRGKLMIICLSLMMMKKKMDPYLRGPYHSTGLSHIQRDIDNDIEFINSLTRELSDLVLLYSLSIR